MTTSPMRAALLGSILGLTVACGGRAPDKTGAPAKRLQVLYALDLDLAVDDKAADVQRDLEAGLADQKISASVRVTAVPPGSLSVTPADDASRPAIEQLIAQYADTLERHPCDAAAPLATICVRISAGYADAVKKAALSSAIRTIRARLDAVKANASVVARGDQIVVEFAATDERAATVRSLIARGGKLELKVVDDDSEYMRQLFAKVGSDGRDGTPTDPRAVKAEINAEIELWQADDDSARHVDYYLRARDREESLPIDEAKQLGCLLLDPQQGQVRCRVSGRQVIERYLRELVAEDPLRFQIPDGRQIAYELIEPSAEDKDQRPYWRTYYLDRTVRLSGSSIANAEGSTDPNTNRPIVLLDFNRAGTQAFGELTSQIIGEKLAILLDGRVKTAPIINGPIRGGRALITLGGGDPRIQLRERDELVHVLESGSLPAPLREESVTEVP